MAGETGNRMPLDAETLENLRSNSRIRLDAEGRFWHEDALVEHPRVAALFHRGLGRAPDGRVTLTAGGTWCYVTVEDALYQARRAWCEAEGDVLRSCRLLLDDESESTLVLAPEQVAIGPDGVLYARVKDGREWARLIPEAHAALGEFVDPEMRLRTVKGNFALARHEPRTLHATRAP